MNILIFLETKKPRKSYDLRGFDSLCLTTGGERGY